MRTLDVVTLLNQRSAAHARHTLNLGPRRLLPQTSWIYVAHFVLIALGALSFFFPGCVPLLFLFSKPQVKADLSAGDRRQAS